MSIMIREYLGYNAISSEGKGGLNNLKENLTGSEPLSPTSIMVDIEGIHVGPTRNYTRYHESALKSSIRSWTAPYEKPLIMHHNEKDGKIIGRIKGVGYTDVNTRSGTGALIFTTNIPDKEGMEQVEDGRLLTVSIGIIGRDVRCSICGHDISEYGPCEHERGQVYEDKICYWDIYEMEGKELSYVIVPSDIYAKNIAIYKPSAGSKAITESAEERKGVSSLKLTEAEIQKLQEDVEALKAEKESLEVKISETEESAKEMVSKEELDKVAAEKEALEARLAEIEKELAGIEEIKAALTAAEDKIKALEDEIAALNGEVSKEKTLRESLETESIQAKQDMKAVLTENYSLLRRVTGKAEISMDTIQERTHESLTDAIMDLKEELKNSPAAPGTISKVIDPTITESISDVVKKKDNVGNIDLEEGLKDLFEDIARIRK